MAANINFSNNSYCRRCTFVWPNADTEAMGKQKTDWAINSRYLTSKKCQNNVRFIFNWTLLLHPIPSLLLWSPPFLSASAFFVPHTLTFPCLIKFIVHDSIATSNLYRVLISRMLECDAGSATGWREKSTTAQQMMKAAGFYVWQLFRLVKFYFRFANGACRALTRHLRKTPGRREELGEGVEEIS